MYIETGAKLLAYSERIQPSATVTPKLYLVESSLLLRSV